jgi:hypothetical protein
LLRLVVKEMTMTNLEFVGGRDGYRYMHLFGGPLVETDDAASPRRDDRTVPAGAEESVPEASEGGPSQPILECPNPNDCTEH